MNIKDVETKAIIDFIDFCIQEDGEVQRQMEIFFLHYMQKQAKEDR